MFTFKFKHFVILQILDVLTTYIGLTYMGLSEQNVFALELFNQFGLINALIGMKIIGMIVIYLLLKMYPLKIKIMALNIITIMFSLVIINNLYWMAVSYV